MGHRNWILIVDAAYPLQSKAGIKTISTGTSQLQVVEKALGVINNAEHVFPEIFLDKELDYINDNAVKGIEVYKSELERLLKDKVVYKELHEELIAKIDESAETFNVLVLKTNLTIPYTSVFIRLNCGYWDGEAEKKLRNRIGDLENRP